MAQVAEQTRGGSRRDVARFLTEHEPCGSDFQIRRFSEGGRGSLSVVCNGCGERAAYELGDPGELKPIAGTDRPPRDRRVTREEIERWLPAPAALPWWVPNAYIVGVILVGLAMIAFGILRDREGEHLFDDRGSGTQPAEQSPAEQQPGEPPATARTDAGAAGAGGEGEGDRERSDRNRVELDRVTVLSRFRIGVPSGWSGATSGGAVVFQPSGGGAELRVFLESGAQRRRVLSREAAAFLEDEHPGARLTKPERTRLGADPAIRVGARYRGGEEWATVLSESGYSYLLLMRIDGDAPKRLERQAETALASFHAL